MRIRAAMPGTVFAMESGIRVSRDTSYELADPPLPHEETVGDVLHLLSEPVAKLLVRHPDADFKDLLQATADSVGADAVVTHSTTRFVEISAVGVNKASGLASLCHEWNVPAEAVIAFGDMPNDIPMLAWAGWGVAVANAHPDVLLIANEVVASNDQDGVAEAIEFLLSTAPYPRRL
jgi:hydroxymethylpyrimidine pyrophosphatase-like HAD family hydrolase